MYLNDYIAEGNLTRDPELRMVQSGNKQVAVVRFTLAMNRSFKRPDGSWDEQADFIPCEAWDSGAEKIVKDFTKGDRMTIKGSVRSDQWEDKNTGEKRSSLKVRVSGFRKVPRVQKAESVEDTDVVTAGEEF
jgi:single-strand DNA-binding protein